MKTVLITGTNRGIGLELCRQYLSKGYHVYATCRHPDKALELEKLTQGQGQLTILKLDVNSASDILAAAQKLNGISVDLLINNAGIYGHKITLDNIEVDAFMNTFMTNAVAPLKVTEAFLPCIRRSEGKTIVTLSSRAGSIEDNTSGNSYAYRASKAAVNAIMKSLAVDLKDAKIKVLILHPGWVKTSMGGPNALIDAKTSVSGLINRIETASIEDSGKFLAFDDRILPW